MRTFRLINELGQSFGLNDVKSGFLQKTKGFGYELDYAFAKIGPYWKEQYIKDTQAKMSGEVVFGTTSPYEAQTEFLQFVRQSKKISLERTTPAGVHLRDVLITEYEISEIEEGNVLTCPISMISTSLWYTNTSERAAIIATADNEFRFPVTWPARINDYSDGYMNVDNDGSCEASFEVEFYGSIDNPVISLEVNDTEIAKVEIDTSITSAQRILYSSRDGALCCFKGSSEAISEYKRSGSTSGLTNLALSFSLSNENFFKFPVGNSKLHITADSTLTNPIMVRIYKYYRAV